MTDSQLQGFWRQFEHRSTTSDIHVIAADCAALLQLHAEQRTAHLEHRADLLVAGQADTLWNVSGGRVSANPREQTRAFLDNARRSN